jgi:chaperonin GroEL
MLSDIAVLTGGTVISESAGMSFKDVTVEQLGHASKVVTTKDTTLIVGGKGAKKAIEERKAFLRAHIAAATDKYEREGLEARLATLSGGVAVIRVGASTETEMRYLKLKIEDAVNATKAAAAEGLVPGGGVALARAGAYLRTKLKNIKDNDEMRIGYSIVAYALEMPLRQIAINAGKADGSLILSQVQTSNGHGGYDAKKDVLVADMFKAGIIDPLRVSRLALQNSSSAAAIFLTTEGVAADIPEPKTPGMPGLE